MSSPLSVKGVVIRGPLREKYDTILTNEAVQFLAELHRKFEPTSVERSAPRASLCRSGRERVECDRIILSSLLWLTSLFLLLDPVDCQSSFPPLSSWASSNWVRSWCLAWVSLIDRIGSSRLVMVGSEDDSGRFTRSSSWDHWTSRSKDDHQCTQLRRQGFYGRLWRWGTMISAMHAPQRRSKIFPGRFHERMNIQFSFVSLPLVFLFGQILLLQLGMWWSLVNWTCAMPLTVRSRSSKAPSRTLSRRISVWRHWWCVHVVGICQRHIFKSMAMSWVDHCSILVCTSFTMQRMSVEKQPKANVRGSAYIDMWLTFTWLSSLLFSIIFSVCFSWSNVAVVHISIFQRWSLIWRLVSGMMCSSMHKIVCKSHKERFAPPFWLRPFLPRSKWRRSSTNWDNTQQVWTGQTNKNKRNEAEGASRDGGTEVCR